ncbi:MAG: tripartite tricarboxylate transporter substrate binding protein [Betaproteobacteria bacterium]|nr:tripartite tricarboxylate transporter substrate binding protein [Betaproteobacteria bacterium]
MCAVKRCLKILIACCLVVSTAHAAYPDKLIRLIVGFGAGGSIDLLARLFAQRLTENLVQQVVVDNRPGASGNLAAEIVARAAADGYTIYMSPPALVVNASLYPKIAYDPLRDFAPVTLLAAVQNVLVAHPGFAAKSVKELIAQAKANPGKIVYASTGSGGSGHLVMEMFRAQAGIDLLHVPYKAIAQTAADLMSGQVSLWFPTMPGALPHIKAGRMRALAAAGAKRSPTLPEVPTMSEAALPGFEASTWYAILTPAGVRKEIIAKLNAEFLRALRAPDMQERLHAQGIEAIGTTPEQLAAHLRSELTKWARVVKVTGVRAE